MWSEGLQAVSPKPDDTPRTKRAYWDGVADALIFAYADKQSEQFQAARERMARDTGTEMKERTDNG